MIKAIRVFVGTLLILPVFSLGVVSAFNPLDASCADNPNAPVCQESTQGESENPLVGEDSILETAANLLAMITAVAAVIVIIVAGITMVVSSGDSAKVKSSRDAIIYAAVGLAVVALARTIVIFIIDRI